MTPAPTPNADDGDDDPGTFQGRTGSEPPTPSAPSLSDEDIHAIANDHGTRDRYMDFARAVIDADRSLRAGQSEPVRDAFAALLCNLCIDLRYEGTEPDPRWFAFVESWAEKKGTDDSLLNVVNLGLAALGGEGQSPIADPTTYDPSMLRHGLKLIERMTDMSVNSTDRYTAEKELNRVMHRLDENARGKGEIGKSASSSAIKPNPMLTVHSVESIGGLPDAVIACEYSGGTCVRRGCRAGCQAVRLTKEKTTDTLRYRWLREAAYASSEVGPWCIRWADDPNDPNPVSIGRADLDAAIDAAIAASDSEIKGGEQMDKTNPGIESAIGQVGLSDVPKDEL